MFTFLKSYPIALATTIVTIVVLSVPILIDQDMRRRDKNRQVRFVEIRSASAAHEFLGQKGSMLFVAPSWELNSLEIFYNNIAWSFRTAAEIKRNNATADELQWNIGMWVYNSPDVFHEFAKAIDGPVVEEQHIKHVNFWRFLFINSHGRQDILILPWRELTSVSDALVPFLNGESVSWDEVIESEEPWWGSQPWWKRQFPEK